MAINILAFSTAAIFFGIGLLHVYWALGGEQASPSVIPTQNSALSFTPTPFMTWLVAVALFTAAAIVLGAAGFGRMGLPAWLFRVGVWGVAVVLTGRTIGDFHWVGFFKTIRNSSFAWNDTWFYSPLCAGLALACATLGAFAVTAQPS